MLSSRAHSIVQNRRFQRRRSPASVRCRTCWLRLILLEERILPSGAASQLLTVPHYLLPAKTGTVYGGSSEHLVVSTQVATPVTLGPISSELPRTGTPLTATAGTGFAGIQGNGVVP